jgi:hypothetical protein
MADDTSKTYTMLSHADVNSTSHSLAHICNQIGICCLTAKHAALRAKTGWLGIRIMCPSEATCLPVVLIIKP